MAGRGRDTRNQKWADGKTSLPIPSTLPLFPTPEEVSFCEAVAGVLPDIDSKKILQELRRDEARRIARVWKLRERVLAGDYHVPPGAVAAAILADGDLLVH
jgi:hypothetical protein